MNAGTIVEAPMIKMRLVGRSAAQGRARQRAAAADGRARAGRARGILHRAAAASATPSPSPARCCASRACRTPTPSSRAPAIPTPPSPPTTAASFPLSTHLAERRARACWPTRRQWSALPASGVRVARASRRERSVIPAAGEVLVETFPRGQRHFLVVYPFEGRLAHQTLGMLLTRRLDRIGAGPLGFVANDYALAVWGIGDMAALWSRAGRLDLADLFAEDMLGDDLDAWLAEFEPDEAHVPLSAVIAGLIERRHPGKDEDAAARSPSRPTSSTTCCASTIPATSCWKRPGPMRPQACSISPGSATSCGESEATSATSRWTASRRWRCRCCWRSARSWFTAAASAEDILREAADDLVREAMQRAKAPDTRDEHARAEAGALHLLPETLSQPVALCGKPLIADSSGALYWPGERRCWSPTCTWRRAPPTPSAAACCRPTTRARR